jgi:hypothetical protein
MSMAGRRVQYNPSHLKVISTPVTKGKVWSAGSIRPTLMDDATLLRRLQLLLGNPDLVDTLFTDKDVVVDIATKAGRKGQLSPAQAGYIRKLVPPALFSTAANRRIGNAAGLSAELFATDSGDFEALKIIVDTGAGTYSFVSPAQYAGPYWIDFEGDGPSDRIFFEPETKNTNEWVLAALKAGMQAIYARAPKRIGIDLVSA